MKNYIRFLSNKRTVPVHRHWRIKPLLSLPVSSHSLCSRLSGWETVLKGLSAEFIHIFPTSLWKNRWTRFCLIFSGFETLFTPQFTPQKEAKTQKFRVFYTFFMQKRHKKSRIPSFYLAFCINGADDRTWSCRSISQSLLP